MGCTCKAFPRILLSLVLTVTFIPFAATPSQAQAASAPAAQSIQLTRVNTGKLVLKKGESYKIGAKTTPSNAKLVYKTSKKSVATVSSKGTIKGKAYGKATITVKGAKGSESEKIALSVVKASKYKAVKSVKLTLATSLVVGDSFKATVTFNPTKPSNKNVIFKSSDTSVLGISTNGTMTAKKAGSVIVSATSGNGKRAEKIVTVTSKRDTDYTPGLEFSYAQSSSGGYITVNGYEGSATDIIVPSSYAINGTAYPVTKVWLSNYNLTSLNVSKCTSLAKLYCDGDELTTLDVGSCASLAYLSCSYNFLTSLDISKNTKLEELDCSYNAIADMSAFVAWKNAGTDRVGAWSSQALKAGITTDGFTYRIYASSADTTGGVYLTHYSGTKQSASIPSTLTVDGTAYNVVSVNISGDETLTSLNVANCTALQELYCRESALTSLTVSGCTSLGILECDESPLTALDASNLPKLTELSCEQCDLTYLATAGDTSLTNLQCSNCPIKSLDVSSCTALKTLTCSDSSLTSLNAASCTSLTSLDCNNNSLSLLGLSSCTALTSLDCALNSITTLDVSTCPNLTEIDCANNKLTSLDTSNCGFLRTLDCSENAKLTTLNVKNNTRLYDLGISECVALTTLDCSDLALEELDVEDCSTLATLDCSGNLLTQLDCTSTPALQSLTCSDNRINDLEVEECSKLTFLKCTNNQLTKLDLSGCTSLQKSGLFCDSGVTVTWPAS